MYRHSMAFSGAVIAVSVLGSTDVFAQREGLDEILVTAQRREQSLQDVPISVTAVTGELIEQGGFSDVEDLSIFVPNLFMRDAFTGQSLIVRGVGTSTGNEAFEQAVAAFSDGVYYGRDNLSQGAVFDLERVEVVRGPQPTFAGQSATAGAINVITRKPGDVWEGKLSGAYGSDEEATFDFAVGGPLSESFGIRVSGRYYELDDAGYTSIIGNVPQGVKEDKAARVIAVWRPTDNLDFTFKYEHQDIWQRGTAGEYTVCETRPQYSTANTTIAPGLPAPCALDAVVNGSNLNELDGKRGTGGSMDARATVDALNAASGATPGSPNYWGNAATIVNIAYGLNQVAEYNYPEDRDFQADIGLGAIDWQIGELTLSTNTSFIEYDKEDWLDPDDSSFAVFNDHRLEDFEQFAQEVRLTSPIDRTLSWMVGAYYQEHTLHSRIDVYLPRLLGTAAYQPAGARAVGFGGLLTEDSEWKSLFFAATYNATDAFRVNFGGRYQDATKDGRLPAEVAFLVGPTATSFGPFQPIPPGNNGGVPAVGTVEASDFLPEVGLEWDVSDNAMAYVKYAEAFKNGGFVMSPPVGGGLPDPFSYAPEFAKGYELGFKSRLADNRVEFNTARLPHGLHGPPSHRVHQRDRAVHHDERGGSAYAGHRVRRPLGCNRRVHARLRRRLRLGSRVRSVRRRLVQFSRGEERAAAVPRGSRGRGPALRARVDHHADAGLPRPGRQRLRGSRSARIFASATGTGSRTTRTRATRSMTSTGSTCASRYRPWMDVGRPPCTGGT